MKRKQIANEIKLKLTKKYPDNYETIESLITNTIINDVLKIKQNNGDYDLIYYPPDTRTITKEITVIADDVIISSDPGNEYTTTMEFGTGEFETIEEPIPHRLVVKEK